MEAQEHTGRWSRRVDSQRVHEGARRKTGVERVPASPAIRSLEDVVKGADAWDAAVLARGHHRV